MSSGLAGAATRGALWLGLINFLSKGSQVAMTLALGVYLTAAELGTATVTVALLQLGLVLQSVGAYDVIARTREDPRVFAGTVATVSVTVAGILMVVGIVLAPQIVSLAGVSEAPTLMRVALLSLPFTAYAGVQIAYMHASLDFRRRLLPDAGSALIGATVTITAAGAGLGEWSLVAGLVTTAVLAPLLALVVKVSIPFRWSRSHAYVLWRWARVSCTGAVLGLVLLNVDYVIISRALGAAATGVYSFAFRIAFLPYVMAAMVLGAVAFPVYTRLIKDADEAAMASAVTRFVHVVVAITGGLYLCIALMADRIVVVDPRWSESVTVLRVLTVYGLLLGLVLTGHEALRAFGRPDLFLRAQIFHVVLLVSAAIALVRRGVEYVAWAQVGAAFMALVLVAAMLGHLGLLRLELVPAILRPALAAGMVAMAFWFASTASLLPASSSLGGGVTVGLLLVVAYAGALVLVDRPLLRDCLVALRRA